MHYEVLIVVARYKEDITWLIPYASQSLIVNKGYRETNVSDSLTSFPNVTKEENIGRESHTYLHFIAKNYHCLPEVIIFTQGKIHDHFSEDVSTLFSRFIEEVNSYGASLPTHVHLTSDLAHKSSWDPDWNVHTVEEVEGVTSTRFILEDCYLDNNKICFSEWFQVNIGRPYKYPFKLYRSAIFAVHKSRILSRPLAFYQSLLRFCSHHIDPAEGHFLERSWYYIFNEHESF